MHAMINQLFFSGCSNLSITDEHFELQIVSGGEEGCCPMSSKRSTIIPGLYLYDTSRNPLPSFDNQGLQVISKCALGGAIKPDSWFT